MTITLTFGNNRLLAELLGEFDCHLAILERRLAIDTKVVGNQVELAGASDMIEVGRRVLEDLWKRLETGQLRQIQAGDFKSAIEHELQAPPVEARGNGAGPRDAGVEEIKTRKKTIRARTPAQSRYLRLLDKHDLVFATGPAGTGKTYLAVVHAAARLERGEVDRIILSRPAVEAGERLGFLPGDMKDKVDPYLRPLYDALYDALPADKVDRGIESKVIEVAPLAFMRGRTLANAHVILDEAQNCSPMQMKMFLTRLGENSRMVVTGDPSQIDLPPGQASGLAQAIKLLEGIEAIGHIAFGEADVVRHPLVQAIVRAYNSAAK